MKETYLIGPNSTYDGCVNHLNGTQMECAGCPAKVTTIVHSKRICEVLENGPTWQIKNLHRRIRRRAERLMDI